MIDLRTSHFAVVHPREIYIQYTTAGTAISNPSDIPIVLVSPIDNRSAASTTYMTSRIDLSFRSFFKLSSPVMSYVDEGVVKTDSKQPVKM